jgi:hypothetical protein
MVSRRHVLVQKPDAPAHQYEMRIQSLRHDVCAPFSNNPTRAVRPWSCTTWNSLEPTCSASFFRFPLPRNGLRVQKPECYVIHGAFTSFNFPSQTICFRPTEGVRPPNGPPQSTRLFKENPRGRIAWQRHGLAPGSEPPSANP